MCFDVFFRNHCKENRTCKKVNLPNIARIRPGTSEYRKRGQKLHEIFACASLIRGYRRYLGSQYQRNKRLFLESAWLVKNQYLKMNKLNKIVVKELSVKMQKLQNNRRQLRYSARKLPQFER